MSISPRKTSFKRPVLAGLIVSLKSCMPRLDAISPEACNALGCKDAYDLQAQPLKLLPRLKVVGVAPMPNGSFLISCQDGHLQLLLPNLTESIGPSIKLQCRSTYVHSPHPPSTLSMNVCIVCSKMAAVCTSFMQDIFAWMPIAPLGGHIMLLQSHAITVPQAAADVHFSPVIIKTCVTAAETSKIVAGHLTQ